MPAINAIFQPNSGALSQYVQSLGAVLVRQGTVYLPNPGSPSKVAPDVINFVNRATTIQQALYASGSPPPQFAYALKWYPSQGIDSLTLTIDGRTHRFTAADPTMQFLWPGTGTQGVTLTAKLTGGSELTFLTYSGLWAVSHFLSEAKATGNHMEWLLSIGGQPARLPNGEPIKVIFDLDTKGAPAIIQPGALSGVSCPAKAAR
jgi:type VI protein secretion system component VasK